VAHSGELVLKITYRPEALFRIRPVTRASSTLEGHGDAILCTAFSPDGQSMASTSGDHTMRIWDLNTETPLHTCKGHSHWVLFVAYSADCQLIATGGHDGHIILWNALTGEMRGNPMKGHKKFVTSIAW